MRRKRAKKKTPTGNRNYCAELANRIHRSFGMLIEQANLALMDIHTLSARDYNALHFRQRDGNLTDDELKRALDKLALHRARSKTA